MKGAPPKKILIFWFPVLIYCVIIFIVSSMRHPPIPYVDILNFDKYLHMIEYGILSYLIIRALIGSEVKLSHAKLIILAVIFATLYGVSDEIHQIFVPGRSANILDVLADFTGASITGFLKR